MAAFDSITNQNVKDYHGFNDATHDTQLTLIRPLVQDFIFEYCRHDFESITRTAESPQDIEVRQNRFYLIFFPVASITSLVENDQTLVEDTDFDFDPRTGRVEKITSLKGFVEERRFGSYWTTQRKGIVVTYEGGEALTQDVKIVFFELVGILAGIKTRTFIDGEGIEQAVTLTNVPPDFLAILDRHRRTRI